MLLAARLREAIGAPGLTVEQTVPFRDKGRMKEVVERAGIRVPHSARATSVAECWAAVERIGYPAIVKPIAGAGSLDTYRLDGDDDLAAALPRLRHVPEVSVEEFIDGEEFTYDTVCADGSIAFYNICRVPAAAARSASRSSGSASRSSPTATPTRRSLAGGKAMGEAVLAAMGFDVGLHPHGVVPDVRRRDGVRRDRRPRARGHGSPT